MTGVTKAVSNLTVWELARLADVTEPDSQSSAGAAFLRSVQDAVVESWENGAFDAPYIEGDTISEIADDAPDIYNHRRMMELIDLAAYQEEIEPELVGVNPTFIDLAGLALYQVAERLAYALLADLRAAHADAVEADVEAGRAPTWDEADVEYAASETN